MYPYAQTNIQLFNQLRREGYSNTDLCCIHNAYQLVIPLFTGCFRASGKTFIAHLVGTASILCALHVPAKVIAAGLLHAAYASGDFGDGGKGFSDVKHQHIKRAVGEEVEDYVAKYTFLRWNEQTIPTIRDRLDALDPTDRNVVLIRLANELEEYLDLGILYCGDVKYQRYMNHNNHYMVEMAEKLGFPTLAVELATVFKETALAEIPVELRNQSSHSASFFLVPNSYRKRLSVAFSHWLVSKLHHLSSAIVHKLRHLPFAIGMRMKSHVKS
ncbi:MAG: HD domain-containing protein [Scytonema sp. RU_4_4]|nr:HD domain-containing protein [Scytonema sp. RU_4_4]NJR73970.1 HD domain-containing protein [Scytonema sp. CRU_2_7]